jgi:hypothetical protein
VGDVSGCSENIYVGWPWGFRGVGVIEASMKDKKKLLEKERTYLAVVIKDAGAE